MLNKAPPNRQYLQVYKTICQEQKVHLSKTITSGLRGQDISINAIMIKIQDIIPLQLLFSVCPFEHIKLFGRPRAKVHRSIKIIQKEDTLTLEEFQQVVNGVLNSINLNLAEPQFNLIQLNITDVLLTNKDCQALSFGIKSTASLKELVIKSCNLTHEHLQILSEALQSCQSLILLDLSNNHLKETAGMTIGKIMSTHASRRDEMKWAVEIRGDEPPASLAISGLCEIALHNNEFDCRCIKDLCQFLMYDSWTKSIGLKNNNIGEEGIALLSDILDTNESLISLDLRDNPGFVEPYSKFIFDKLVRNIRIFKESKQYETETEQNDQQKFTTEQDNNTIEEQDEEDAPECPNCRQLLKQNQKLQQQLHSVTNRIRHESQTGDLMSQIEAKMNELTQLMDQLEQSKQKKKKN